MYGPEENSLGSFLWAEFCFPDSPDVSRDEVRGNIRSRGKTNLSFLLPVDCEQSLSFLSVFLAFLRAGVELLSSERLICIILTQFCAGEDFRSKNRLLIVLRCLFCYIFRPYSENKQTKKYGTTSLFRNVKPAE